MTSTEFNIGLNTNSRPSSRVLKPPGGGYSNIFPEPEVSANAPRAKYNQQNSSNLTDCIGSTAANQAVAKLREEVTHHKGEPTKTGNAAAGEKAGATTKAPSNATNDNPRGRVPPGGYSSGGFW